MKNPASAGFFLGAGIGVRNGLQPATTCRSDCRWLRRQQTVSGHSRFWVADYHHADAMLRAINSQSRYSEVKRSLTMSLTLEEEAMPLGHRQHVFPYGKVQDDVIYQMRCCFAYAPRVARVAHATGFARIGDQGIVLALVAVGADENTAH